jgi:ribosomal protein L20
MARATNSPASRKRRKKVLKYAKGYFGNKSKLFRYAKEAVQHAWQYAYRDRKKKKGEWRSLWIVRLNAACRAADISYSRFIEGLKAAGSASTARSLPTSPSTTRSPSRPWSSRPASAEGQGVRQEVLSSGSRMEMQEQLSSLLAKASAELQAIRTRPELESAKARYVGPNGEFTALMKQMGSVAKELRPAMGKLVNESKASLQALLDARLRAVEEAELSARLGPAIDPTLPSPDPGPGTFHPLTLVREEVCRILRKVGFTVADGPEVETEFYCFDALNTPRDHPARDRRTRSTFPGGAPSRTSPSTSRASATSCARTPPRSRCARC